MLFSGGDRDEISWDVEEKGTAEAQREDAVLPIYLIIDINSQLRK
ncbi:MAG: hypothetical protein V7K55_19000 [Nostoc sp.]